MGKTAVYSWRLDVDKKRHLEAEARRRGTSVAALLERMSSEWLSQQGELGAGEAAEQRRLHAALAACIGTVRGGDPRRSAKGREAIRKAI
ncbi:MAG: hypothetical protein MUC42_02255, partial [Bryobacter sp.]|nr:hypothetical protein [Bryobacter sp.]